MNINNKIMIAKNGGELRNCVFLIPAKIEILGCFGSVVLIIRWRIVGVCTQIHLL